MNDQPTNPEVREALQMRDIETLRQEIKDEFQGVHERQDVTNGKVLKAAAAAAGTSINLATLGVG